MKYEYKTGIVAEDLLQGTLAIAGEDGYELVSSHRFMAGYEAKYALIFKRPIATEIVFTASVDGGELVEVPAKKRGRK